MVEKKQRVTEMKNSRLGLHNRSEQQEKASCLEEKSIQMIHFEESKGKRSKKNEPAPEICGSDISTYI